MGFPDVVTTTEPDAGAARATAPRARAGVENIERVLLALFPPLVTTVVQYAFWPILKPFAWLLFYPAVFISSSIGGLRGGVAATALSTVLVWWFFVPPHHTLAKSEARFLVAALAFAVTGTLFSVLHARLRDATRMATAVLAKSTAASDNLNRAQEIAHLGSWRLEVDRDDLSWSDEVYRIFGIPIGTPMTYEHFLARVHPDDRSKVDVAWAAALRGAPYDVEHRILVDGTERWVRERAQLELDRSGRVIAGTGTVQDITERKRAEAELVQAIRAHRALSRCNEAVVRATDDAGLLAEVCRIAVDDAGYRFCWIGRAEDDEARTLRAIAQAGFEDGYLSRARITWADTERGRGPTGTAARERRVIVCKDIATDPSIAPWRDEALRRGYASSVAIPLDLPARRGVMTIYASEPGAFADAEVALLRELARDLEYGIETLRTRAERDRAQDELRQLNVDLEQRVAKRTAELRAARAREAEIGARIHQMLLLDEPPRDVRGLAVAALTVPSQQIAGDFYGFFHHESFDCLDVLLADVMGKGIPAALLGAATKSYFPHALWNLLAESSRAALPEPDEIVTLAHASMARHLIGLESFVTSCYARFDVVHRRVELVDCGHTGMVHFRPATGRCEIVHGDNLPLGIHEGEIFDQLAIPIEIGDVVVLFSDGVTEARDAHGELFGADRLVDCVRAYGGGDPAALVHAVRDAAAEFAGSRWPADDLTCLVVEMVPHEVPLARAELEARSVLGELRRTRELVARFCTDELSPPLAEDDVASLVLAVHEAASNIIKHAYRGQPDQRIEVAIEAFRDRVAVRLRYVGPPFDPAAVPPPSFDGSRDSGFGVFLIAESVDTVRYYRDDLERSCIHLEKRRRPVSSPR